MNASTNVNASNTNNIINITHNNKSNNTTNHNYYFNVTTEMFEKILKDSPGRNQGSSQSMNTRSAEVPQTTSNMSTVADSTSNYDDRVDMDELHDRFSNIILPDETPPSLTDSRIFVHRTNSDITHMYSTTQDEFHKVTIVLAHGLIYDEDIGQHHDSKYLHIGIALLNIFCSI